MTLLSSTAGQTTVRTDRRGRAPLQPPAPPGDSGGGDDGGGGASWEATPTPEEVGRFALLLALVGITTLFAVLTAVCFFLRRSAGDWTATGEVRSGGALIVAGACLFASGLAVEAAARAAQAWRARTALRWLAGAAALGLAFLAAQFELWLRLWHAGHVPAASGYAATFFALTGLHALHVLGGLTYFAVLARSLRLAAAVRREMPSLRPGALYWHYMGLLWVVLVAVLVLSA
jgi:heme/copper-type cytochrome/quinol oxidase subunit 3